MGLQEGMETAVNCGAFQQSQQQTTRCGTNVFDSFSVVNCFNVTLKSAIHFSIQTVHITLFPQGAKRYWKRSNAEEAQ